MKYVVCFTLGWFLLATSASTAGQASHSWQSGTIIGGGYVSGTWTKAGSPYQVQGHIAIQAESTLTIEPGVDIGFEGYYSLTVNGILEAVGTETDSIHFFPSDTSIGWQGLIFGAGSDSSQLEYGVITGSKWAGIFITGSSPVVSDCLISNNGGPFYGGIGLANSNAKISNNTIEENSTSEFGGGIRTSNSSPQVINCTIKDNYAVIRGGGVAVIGGNPVISESDISQNRTSNSGGGISVEQSGNPTISNCTINHNLAELGGGGIYFGTGGNGTLVECTLNADTTNDGFGDGGGISISSLSGQIIVTNCTFEHCFAYYNGGAISISSASRVSVSKSIFDMNGISYDGAAIFSMNCDSLLIDHCNFTRNSVYSGGGAVLLHGSTNLVLSNSIFVDEYLWEISFENYLSVSIQYNDFGGSQSGSLFYKAPANLGILTQVNDNNDSCDTFHNIFLDPLFVDLANGNFNLTASSPCIDAGDPNLPNDSDGTVCDIGVYSYISSTPECCIGNRGNANGDPEDKLNITDITYLIQYLFGVPTGPAPVCTEEANANGDPEEKINITDITYLVQYLFGVPTGPAPPSCP